MPQQPTTLTDRLANVIQVIQLGRKTGTLNVERNSDMNLERGTICFVNGMMTQASAHQLNGLAAFQWLNTWGSCRFNFTPSDSANTTRKLPSLPTVQLQVAENQSSNDTNPTLEIQSQGKTLPGSGRENNQKQLDDLTKMKVPVRIPRQLRSLEDAVEHIERMKLSRAHRHLFLLIDGHRNTADLARLMGRRQVEVVAMLRDLERADVVKH